MVFDGIQNYLPMLMRIPVGVGQEQRNKMTNARCAVRAMRWTAIILLCVALLAPK